MTNDVPIKEIEQPIPVYINFKLLHTICFFYIHIFVNVRQERLCREKYDDSALKAKLSHKNIIIENVGL